MGLTVIPTAVAGLLPTSGASADFAAETLAGEFAALLSGELLSLQVEPSIIADRANEDSSSRDVSVGASGPDPSFFAAFLGHFDSKAMPAVAVTTPSRPNAELPATKEVLASNSRQRVLLGENDSKLADLARPATTNQADETAIQLSDRSQLPTATTAERGASSASFGNLLAASLRSPPANIAGDNRANDSSLTDEIPPATVNTNQPVSIPEKPASGDTRHTTVNAHLHSAGWPHQLGDKIVWLARNEQQSAQLTINPPQLGPIQISLNLSGDQASITFASPHAEVRQAIESAMPHLKEMLSSAGISLGQSNVGANLSQQSAENPFAGANGKRSADENAILPANDKAANAPGNPVLQRGHGLVDLFA
jgi:flagellar hook-length control protein FliK